MSNVINKSEIKIRRKGAASAETGITLYISNEDLNYIIQIIKLSEDLGVLIDAYTETVKRQKKKKKWWISWSFVSTFSHFNSTTSNFFIIKRFKRKRIY